MVSNCIEGPGTSKKWGRSIDPLPGGSAATADLDVTHLCLIPLTRYVPNGNQ